MNKIDLKQYAIGGRYYAEIHTRNGIFVGVGPDERQAFRNAVSKFEPEPPAKPKA